jgi:hypothetical protein
MPNHVTAVAGPTAVPIFHLHPLLRCNLRCLHCYSDSSPQSAQILSQADAIAGIDIAAAWGYSVLAVSGGEPLLYPGLADLLDHAQALGMTRSVVTNGLLLNHANALAALRKASTVTVSIDGLAENHDRMRARQGAFGGAADAVRRLSDAGIETWISCGVSAINLDEIEAVVDQAEAWGARGVNFHAVEKAGRANDMSDSVLLSADERLLLYTAGNLLAAINQGRIEVHIDLMHRSTVLAGPHLIYAQDTASFDAALPAQLLGVLVMSADGTLLPVCYGFDRRFALGKLDEGFEPSSAWRRFLAGSYPALQQLGAELLRELIGSESRQVLNPSEWLAERSHTAPAAADGQRQENRMSGPHRRRRSAMAHTG